MDEPVTVSRKPADTAFKQQRLAACRPIFTPIYVGLTFLLVGVPFIIIGTFVKQASDEIVELKSKYDGTGDLDTEDCKIYSSGEGRSCTISFTAKEDMNAPIYVYYELSNFYQNHRRYVKSYSKEQLLGCTSDAQTGCSGYDAAAVEAACEPLVANGSRTLSPCGLIANSLFNDVLVLSSGQGVRYDGTAWGSDADKYAQPHGFKATPDDANGYGAACLGGASGGAVVACDDATCANALGPGHAGCKAWRCPSDPDAAAYLGCDPAGAPYTFYYPNEDQRQYLYESFPEVVSPVVGVGTDRFKVWMRTAALPSFRKLYAKITDDVKKGDVLSFAVKANFNVAPFEGSKALVLTTATWFGGKNAFLGDGLVAVGTLCAALGIAFFVKHAVAPRSMGDLKYLQ